MDIRKATIEDAGTIALNVMAAMDFDVFSGPLNEDLARLHTKLTDICAREDTLYSWKNTLVACVDGTVIGSLTSYNGADYVRMRDVTFGLVKERLGWVPPMVDDETKEGEWYLDSLAVLPEFRKKGVARFLINQSLETGEALGFTLASLIVLASAERLIAFYESCGFTPDGHLDCFGHDYLRMVSYM